MAREQWRTKTPGVYGYKLANGETRYGGTVWVTGPWGARKQLRVEGKLREKDVKAWRAEQMADSAAGLAVAGGDLKFGTWVEKYLALRRGSVTHGSWRVQRNRLEWFRPLFGLSLSRLTPALIAARLVELQQAHAVSTVKAARGTLSQCLRLAVEYGLLARNPVRSTKVAASEPARERFWDAAEIGRLLAVTDADPEFGPLCRVLAETWLRVGEACGLTWADIDLARGEVHVRRTARYGRDGWELADAGKTANATRVLPIGPELVRALRERQDRDRLATGKGWHPGRVVFGFDGQVRNTSWVSYRLEQMCAVVGIPVAGPHMFRHAGATIAIRGGMDPKVVSERLGHATVAFTLQVYRHPNEADHRAAAAAFVDLISGAL